MLVGIGESKVFNTFFSVKIATIAKVIQQRSSEIGYAAQTPVSEWKRDFNKIAQGIKITACLKRLINMDLYPWPIA